MAFFSFYFCVVYTGFNELYDFLSVDEILNHIGKWVTYKDEKMI